MELDEEYPRYHSDHMSDLRRLLAPASNFTLQEKEDIAVSINEMADKARDLVDIFQRLVLEVHSQCEIGELLIAFELTTEQLRGNSDVIDGKLYDIADRLRGIEPGAADEEDEPEVAQASVANAVE